MTCGSSCKKVELTGVEYTTKWDMSSKSDSSCDEKSQKQSLVTPPQKRQKIAYSSGTDSSCGSSWSSVKSRFSISQWNRENLEEVGVFFGENPMPLTDLFYQLRMTSPSIEYPTYLKIFADYHDYAREAMPFSFNIEEIQEIKTETLLNLAHKEISVNIQKCIKDLFDMEKVWESGIDQNTDKKLFKILLKFWIVNVFNFLTTAQNLMEKLIADQSSSQKSGKKTEDIRQSSYRKLIMKFTEVFFLNPEQGESKKKDIMIRNKKVGCIPDVQFFQERVSADSSEQIIMLIEVKRSGLRSPSPEEGNSIQGKFRSEVLGQIGAELLAECSKSAFCPQILGIVCMRTEVIFMILSIEFSHLRAILQNESVAGKHACIEYSRSYDVLNAEDREEMAEILLWLACVQKKDFHRYYLPE